MQIPATPFVDRVSWYPFGVNDSTTWLYDCSVLYSLCIFLIWFFIVFLIAWESQYMTTLRKSFLGLKATQDATATLTSSSNHTAHSTSCVTSNTLISVEKSTAVAKLQSGSPTTDRAAAHPIIAQNLSCPPGYCKLCAFCPVCKHGQMCHRGVWTFLENVKLGVSVYAGFAVPFGFLVFLLTCTMAALPSTTVILETFHDPILGFLNNIRAEWSICLYIVSHAVLALAWLLILRRHTRHITRIEYFHTSVRFTLTLQVYMWTFLFLSFAGVLESVALLVYFSRPMAPDWRLSLVWSLVSLLLWVIVLGVCLWSMLCYRRLMRIFFSLGEDGGKLQWMPCLTLIIDSKNAKVRAVSTFDRETSVNEDTVRCICCVSVTYEEIEEGRRISVGGVPAKKNSPYETASWVSRLTFSWCNSLLSLGYSRSLTVADLFKLSPNDTSHIIGAKLQQLWIDQKIQYGDDASLLGACFLFTRGLLLRTALLKLLFDTLNFSNPFLLKYFMDYLDWAVNMLFTPAQLRDHSVQRGLGALTAQGFAVVALMFILNCFQTLILQRYFYILFNQGTRLRAGIISIVYKKALKAATCSFDVNSSQPPKLLSHTTSSHGNAQKPPTEQVARKKGKEQNTSSAHATEPVSIGHLVNLMSVDSQRVLDCLPYIHILWSAIYQILLALCFLWFEMGHAMWSGVAVMVTVIPITASLARYLKKTQEQLMRLRDNRVKRTSEVFSAIRIVKMYAWEKTFEETINEMRKTELRELRKYILLTILQRILWIGVPVLVSFVTFFTFCFIGNELTAAKAFTAITLFQYLAFPLGALPNAISLALEARVAIHRIQTFLLRRELPKLPPPLPILDLHEPTIVVKNLSSRWRNGVPLLHHVSFSCFPGTITTIIGKTGIGKTGLLLTLIGELDPTPSSQGPLTNAPLTILGRFVYVAQVTWIQNDTLKNNILFGLPYNETWYQKVIYACALVDDMKLFPWGDETEIGENGVNLSGGQKQRVTLARAVYQCLNDSSLQDFKSADIFILDDCLSAVDAHVAQHIFQHCILGLLKNANKTVVLVTHQVKFLSHVDQIIVLDRDASKNNTKEINGSTVVMCGTFKELCTQNLSLYEELIYHQPAEQESNGGVKEEKQQIQDTTIQRTVSYTQPELVSKASHISDDQRNTAGNNTTAGVLIQEEAVQHGSVGLQVYWLYFKSIGGIPVILLLLTGLFLGRIIEIMSHFWLSYWSDHRSTVSSLPTGISVLGILSVLQLLFFSLYFLAFGMSSISASSRIHVSLIQNLLRAPVTFFDGTPLSRIVNRVSKDMNTVDQTLQSTMGIYGKQVMIVVGTFFVICYAAPWFLLFCVPLIIIYLSIQQYYIPTSRQLQRLDSALKSPVFAHIAATLTGVTTIRAFRFQKRFKAENELRLDAQQEAYYLSIAANRWLGTRLEFLGTLVVTFSSLFVLLRALNNTISNGLVGIVVSYSLNITQSLNWMVRMASECETNVVSVERIQEYLTEIPQEQSQLKHATQKHESLCASWPQQGSIRFINFSLRYRQDLPLTLKSLNVNILPKEKVGVVGRTGAGKSSMLSALLRLVEASHGRILIDDVDIAAVPLHRLRSSFSIITQDPVLFTGTLRFNLDPFNEYTDDLIWSCLKSAFLEDFVRDQFPGRLYGAIEENGKNISHGQRQLICLARALLRQSCILLLDEATSAVDTATDQLIQQTIRSAFKNCTIVTMAHRLSTIIDYDKILVLSKGRIVEFGTPADLLDVTKTPSGVLRALWEKDRLHYPSHDS